uniref:SH2 domain-containing protein n=1 Tax=Caenorhabditis tropicalis TaxID=1561998 RepID=A0A1I7U461_9PELO
MRGSNGYPPRGNYENYSNPTSGHGQMVINMKTTVTTSGGQHNGLVVHSAIQSASPSTSQSSWMSPYSESPSRRIDDGLDMIRSNTSLHRSSPLPIQMVPSTSRETLISIGREGPSKMENSHLIPPKPPSPPPSPIYSFKGRDSPPDEFIQPTKLVLNVFRPKHQEPSWQTPISRSQVSLDSSSGGIQLSKKNALLNDAVTTTTTVEVFRAPLNGDSSMISLTPSPFGGAPLLVRAHGPSYEQWNDRKVQTMMTDDDRRDLTKGVQWKERLIEESDRRYRDSGSEFYDEIADPPQFIHHDYRPKPTFQPVTHPIVMTGSRDDLRSQPPPYHAPLSPLYIVPDRHRHQTNSVSPGQWSRRSNGYQERDERKRDERRIEPRDEYHKKENEQNQNRERYHHRRSKSSTRDDSSVSHRSLRHRSVSPSSRRSLATSIGGSQEEILMERVIDELEMISSPLAESEDSLISEMSNRNDVTRSSWLEYRGIRRKIVDGNESDFEEDEESDIYGPPPIPQRDYSRISIGQSNSAVGRRWAKRSDNNLFNDLQFGFSDKDQLGFNKLRPFVYRKRGEEFPMRRSKSYEKPGRPRTPEKKWTRNARSLVDKSKKINAIYATPIRKKITLNAVVEPPIIEEFMEEVPRYARSLRKEEQKKEEKEEEKMKEMNQIPVIDMSTEIEFSSKVERPIGKLIREDSLTSLLKRQLSSKNHHKKRDELPEYVEPKDPIIKELQEFLKIEPKSSEENSQNSTSNSIIEKETKEEPSEKTVQADEHRLIVRGWEQILKSSSSSSSSSSSAV